LRRTVAALRQELGATLSSLMWVNNDLGAFPCPVSASKSFCERD
jgi:hypothetical protein